MAVGSIPDSPPMPAGETAEDRERAWADAHPPQGQVAQGKVAQGQPVVQQQQQPQHHLMSQQQPVPASGGQALYPQPVAGIRVRGM